MFRNNALKLTKLSGNIRKISNEASYYIPFVNRPTFKISETDYAKDVINHPLFKEASDEDKREIIKNLKLIAVNNENHYHSVCFDNKLYYKNTNGLHFIAGTLVRSVFIAGLYQLCWQTAGYGIEHIPTVSLGIYYNIFIFGGIGMDAYVGRYVNHITWKFKKLKQNEINKKFDADIDDTLKKLSK